MIKEKEKIENIMDEEVSINLDIDSSNVSNEETERKGKIREKKIKDYTKKGKKCNIVFYIIGIIIFLASFLSVGFCLYKLHELDMLPQNYFQLILLGAGTFELITAVVILARRSHVIARVIFCILSILIGAVCVVGIKYLIKTTEFLDNVITDNKNLKTFYVLTKIDSSYASIEDLNKKSMHYYNNELVDSTRMLEHVLALVELEIYAYESNEELGSALIKGDVDSIILEASYRTLLEEQLEGFKDGVKEIYKFELEEQDEDIAKEVESISTTPFVVYIAGVDTWGDIDSVSRSDVNMVAAINPSTHQVLLVTIPRDYYVQLHGTYGVKDKLTHAGIYGINKSVTTIEDLLHTDINYYMKVNFTSLVDIVNALGGITVYSQEAFKTTYDYLNISFKQGYNEINGWEALAFCRERKDFELGDRMRGVNQTAVLTAIIKKACSYSVITRFEDLLAAIEGKFSTNMSLDSIRDLVKYQLSTMKEWTVTSLALNGKDARAYTYAMGLNNLLYVMLPDDSQVQNARDKIDAILAGEILDGSAAEIKDPVVSQKYYDEIQALIDKRAKEEAEKKAKEEAEKKAQEEAAKKEEEENNKAEQGGENLPENEGNVGGSENEGTTVPPTNEGEQDGTLGDGNTSGEDGSGEDGTGSEGETTTPEPSNPENTTPPTDSDEVNQNTETTPPSQDAGSGQPEVTPPSEESNTNSGEVATE